MKTKVGFIGLGIMGKPMAKNLMAAGHGMVVYDINQQAAEELIEAGAEAAASPSDVAARCEVVITMLPASSHVRSVVMGENGILMGARPGTILVDMSSIDPMTVKDLAAQAAGKGVSMLDAPVSGGEPKAIDGTLAIMVGGSQEAFDRVKEILLVMGSSAILVGDIGSGSITKLANQIMVNLNIAAMGEALVLAAKAGVDPGKVYQAIRGGLAGSTVLEQKGPKVLGRDFAPGGRIDINYKDLTNVMNTAHELSVPLTLSGQLLEILRALMVEGNAQDDHAGIVKYYEKLAQVTVRSETGHPD